MKNVDVEKLLKTQEVKELVDYVHEELLDDIEKWARSLGEKVAEEILWKEVRYNEGVKDMGRRLSRVKDRLIGISDDFIDYFDACYKYDYIEGEKVLYDVANKLVERVVRRVAGEEPVQEYVDVSWERIKLEKSLDGAVEYYRDLVKELKEKDEEEGLEEHEKVLLDLYESLAGIYTFYKNDIEEWYGYDEKLIERLIRSLSINVARLLEVEVETETYIKIKYPFITEEERVEKETEDYTKIKEIVEEELEKAFSSEAFKAVLKDYMDAMILKLESEEFYWDDDIRRRVFEDDYTNEPEP